jgi:hypothetical protein
MKANITSRCNTNIILLQKITFDIIGPFTYINSKMDQFYRVSYRLC